GTRKSERGTAGRDPAPRCPPFCSAFRVPRSALVLMCWRTGGMPVRGVGKRIGTLVLFLLAGVMMMPGLAVVHLGLHRRRRNPRRVFEHELAADPPGPHDTDQPGDAEETQRRLLHAAEPNAADQPPRQHDGEDAH